MAEIDILMATYNGSKYVDKQILSILAQDFNEWRLIIHDDGSTDNTLDLIKKYEKIDSRINLISDNQYFHDPAKHFLYILKFASAPFVCFCDQDDIWMESKLRCMHEIISIKDHNIPQVIFSDAYLLKDGKIGGRLIFSHPHHLNEILFTNGGIHGSASMFNKTMVDFMLKTTETCIMHDHLLTLIGCSIGELTYMTNKLFLYRQHENNVTGNMETNLLKRLIIGIKSSRNGYVLSENTIDGVKFFLEVYKGFLKKKDMSILTDYINLRYKSPVRRFFSIIKNNYTLGDSKLHLYLKILTRRFVY